MVITEECSAPDCDGHVSFELGPHVRTADHRSQVVPSACDRCGAPYELRTNINRM